MICHIQISQALSIMAGGFENLDKGTDLDSEKREMDGKWSIKIL